MLKSLLLASLLLLPISATSVGAQDSAGNCWGKYAENDRNLLLLSYAVENSDSVRLGTKACSIQAGAHSSRSITLSGNRSLPSGSKVELRVNLEGSQSPTVMIESGSGNWTKTIAISSGRTRDLLNFHLAVKGPSSSVTVTSVRFNQ